MAKYFAADYGPGGGKVNTHLPHGADLNGHIWDDVLEACDKATNAVHPFRSGDIARARAALVEAHRAIGTALLELEHPAQNGFGGNGTTSSYLGKEIPATL